MSSSLSPINLSSFEMREMINNSDRGFAVLGLDGVGVDKERQRAALAEQDLLSSIQSLISPLNA